MSETVHEAFARLREELKNASANVQCDECGEFGCSSVSCHMIRIGLELMLCGQWTRDPEWHFQNCLTCREKEMSRE